MTFSAGKTAKIIQNLNSNKEHRHDSINTPMFKICGDTISKPLELILKQVLITGSYFSHWKKCNIVPVHKKDDKQDIKSYCLVSLLSICGKGFERI